MQSERSSRKRTLQKYVSDENLTPTQGVDVSLNEKLLSVVIPAYNEEAFISEILKSLDQTTIPIEIIVIDNNSTDKTVDVIHSFANTSSTPITILQSDIQGPAFARKRGMDELVVQHLNRGTPTKNRYIAMTDADCKAPIEWAETIIKTFKKTNASALGGRYKYNDDLDRIIEKHFGIQDFFGYLPQIAFHLASTGISAIHTNGANAAIEAVPYARIGGSQQPKDKHGNAMKGSDLYFGNALRTLGESVAFLPIMIETSARREIYALWKKTSQGEISTLEGWVDSRILDTEFLEYVQKDFTREGLLIHRRERENRFLYVSTVLPILLHQIKTNQLSHILDEKHPSFQLFSNWHSQQKITLARMKKQFLIWLESFAKYTQQRSLI